MRLGSELAGATARCLRGTAGGIQGTARSAIRELLCDEMRRTVKRVDARSVSLRRTRMERIVLKASRLSGIVCQLRRNVGERFWGGAGSPGGR